MKEVKVGRLWGFKQCPSVSLALEQGSTKLQSFQAQNQYIWVLLNFPITFQILYSPTRSNKFFSHPQRLCGSLENGFVRPVEDMKNLLISHIHSIVII